MLRQTNWRRQAPRYVAALCLLCAGLTKPANGQTLTGRSIVHKVDAASDRIEMLVNSSRILTLESKIPQVQVNNPDILEVTPRSPNKVQLFAKQPGVTQVNLWDDEDNIHSVDVIIYADARELTMILHAQFPSASLKVIPLANSVIVSGYVDNPSHVAQIIEIAQDFHPQVINIINVGGVQQIMLRVKVMEVSRTKMRDMGFDFANISGSDFVASGVSGLLASSVSGGVASLGGHTMNFGVVDGSNQFFGLLSALRENNLLKILAEPDLVTVSGRPAHFNVGGEFPILVPQSLGTVSIEYKKFGTQVDFVPIVLGNGHIRLEVRPRVSELDDARSVTIGDINVPALRVREVETGVEMRAGQTLALAGLVQSRVEAENRGIPLLGDLPFIGGLFRRVQHEYNEIELVILVTPELVEAMDPHEVPPGGPGTNTCSPGDCDLYFKGHLEVPCCNDGTCGYCQPCRVGPGIPYQPSYGGAVIQHGEIVIQNGGAYEVHPQIQDEPVFPEEVIIPEADPSARGPQLGPTVRAATLPNRYNRRLRTGSQTPRGARPASPPPGLIGPIGYDVD